MKYRIFGIRLINLILIFALIILYNSVLIYRSQQDEIAKLSTQIEEYKATVAAYEEMTGTGTEESDDAAFKDGTYEGTSPGYGGNITVSVTVSDGKIASVDILSAAGEDALRRQHPEGGGGPGVFL